ncbi:MAG: hypothetical protein ACKOGB_03825 [Betaproteobacteria bacterium]
MSLQGLPAGLECITMPKDFNTMEDSNRSSNPSIHDVSNPARRLWVRGAGGGALLSALAGCGGAGRCER